MASIQSIGLGSGTLKQSQIDDLKKVDEKALLEPIRRDITKEKEKSTDLSSLSVVASGAKGAQNALSEEISYLKTKVSQVGDSIEVTVEDGVTPRSLDFEVKRLATKEIIESNSFLLKTQTISQESSNFAFYINGKQYSIPIVGSKEAKEDEEATTYQDFTNLISDKTKGEVIASILEIGGDTPFKMILQTKNEGSLNKILMGPSIKGSKSLDIKTLQSELFVKDSFSINGLEILDGLTKSNIQSESILIPQPESFKTKDFFINDVDIFSTTDPTFLEGKEILNLNIDAKSGDLKINGIDIFNASSKPEIQSSVDINSIKFPVELQTQGLLINKTDIFDNIEPTSVISGTINNKVVSGEYLDNNLVINGVNIFEQTNNKPIKINSVQQLVNAINIKKETTNVKASLVQINGANSKITITSLVPGDNIDVYTNDNIVFSKFRLMQGSTRGKDTRLILNSADLVDAINAKSGTSNAIASIRDEKLIISSKDSSSLSLGTLNQSNLAVLGLKTTISDAPIGLKVSSIDSLVNMINEKISQTNVKATIENNKIVLTSLSGGSNLQITGKDVALSSFGLEATTIDPLNKKTITNIDDVINSINEHKDITKVEATKKGNFIQLIATQDNINIQIKGDVKKLKSIGFKEEESKFQNGQIISSKQQLADLINLKYTRTDTKAIIKNDRVVLYNPKNSSIVITGDTDKLLTLGLSETLSHKSKNNLADITLYKKLGFNDPDNLIQEATNSLFLYNNVELERNSNTINDLAVGLSVQLKRINIENENSSVDIEIDKTLIEESVKNFVVAYNSFVRKLEDVTKFEYNEKKGVKDSLVGSFQGIPNIVNIPYKFNSIITTVDPQLKSIRSLESLGITFLDKSNSLDINESKLKNAIASNFEEVKKLLMGHTYTSKAGKELEFNGIFKDINTQFNSLTKGDKSVFKTIEDKIATDIARMEENLEKSQKYLDEKYKQMQQDFIANDLAISKINNNFNSLKQQIDLETANK